MKVCHLFKAGTYTITKVQKEVEGLSFFQSGDRHIYQGTWQMRTFHRREKRQGGGDAAADSVAGPRQI